MTGILLNLAFIAVEVTAGLLAGSLALLADAGHNFSDVVALLLAWAGTRLVRRPSSRRFTYGFKRASLLIALVNIVLLFFSLGIIAVESVRRLRAPTVPDGAVVMLVAGLGIFVNGFTAFLLRRGRERDLNVRAAFWHMIADALISLGVVAAGALVLLLRETWIDPVASLAIVAVVLVGTRGLLREALRLAVDAVPAGTDPAAVRDYLLGLPGVVTVHDLHIWALSASEAILTAHLVIPHGYPGDAFIDDAARVLRERFGICHTTLQVETRAAADACDLETCVKD